MVGRGAVTGEAVFAISIGQGGVVSVAQWESIEHPNTASYDEAVNLGTAVVAVVTANCRRVSMVGHSVLRAQSGAANPRHC